MCIVLYIYQVWCSGVQGIYTQLAGGSIYHGYMCIVLYIYRSATFGVMVFKSSMLDCKGVHVP